MKKIFKNLALFVLSFCILVSSIPLTALAKEQVKKISSEEEWIEFAKKCKTDSYSKGLKVQLVKDLKFSEDDNIVVPVFCGEFNGNGHRIQTGDIKGKTGIMGLFRVIKEDAKVENLKVKAKITEEDETTEVGILCGENYGTIQKCSVYGKLSGHKNVAAIAGINHGMINDCFSNADIEGTYHVAGIAGTNEGTISRCKNKGKINLKANEQATNVGGIAGVNENVIQDCTNEGKIGYLHTGYNVGGIVGLTRGFIQNNKNLGIVSGRRDVGGITGQMEPSFRVEYGQNAMELLDDSVSGFSSTMDQVISEMQGAISQGASGLNGVVNDLTSFSRNLSANVSTLFSNMTWIENSGQYIDNIRAELNNIRDNLHGDQSVSGIIDKINNLLDQFDQNNPSVWPDQMRELMDLLKELSDAVQQNKWVGDSLNNISDNFSKLSNDVVGGFQNFGEQSTSILQQASEGLANISQNSKEVFQQNSNNVDSVRNSISKAVNSMDNLQNSVDKVLSGRVSDVEDISAQVSAKDNGMVVSCANAGKIEADYNVGGIVGNLSKELSVDQETDALPSVDDVLFTDTTLYVRATLYGCQNSGNISAKYKYTGGIVGYGNRGSIVQCENSGNEDAGKEYVGGISGYFRGDIETCDSIGSLKGESHVAGIAGEAAQIQNCRAIPYIEEESAYSGGIAGIMENGEGNRFVSDSLGGVNGISYQGVAESIAYHDLAKEKNLPESFKKINIMFEVEGKPVKTVTVPYGGHIEKLPKIASRDGKYWHWNKFEKECIRYNQTVDGEWKNFITTLSTGAQKPKFLVEGKFNDQASLEVDKISEECTKNVLASKKGTYVYRLSVKGSKAKKIKVRYHMENEGKLYQVQKKNKKEIAYERDGKYIVFSMKNGGVFLFEEDNTQVRRKVILKVFGMLVLTGGILGAGFFVYNKKKEKKKS